MAEPEHAGGAPGAGPDSNRPAAAEWACSRRLSEDLHGLAVRAKDSGMSLRQIEAALKGRGFAALIIVITLPFTIPVMLPGASILFGLAIAFMGLRLAIGRHPWLPAFVLDHQISSARLVRILEFGARWAKRLEKFTRPRLAFLHSWPLMSNLAGFCIFAGGLGLTLPPPMINSFPALAVVCVTIGLMERDGVFILLGFAATVLMGIYLAALVFFGGMGVEWLIGWLDRS